MNSIPKSLSLIAAIPLWAQEPQIASLRQTRSSPPTGTPSDSGSSPKALLRVDEAAAMLKVSSKTVRRLLARGDLKAVRVGRLVRIHSSEIDRLFAGGCPSGGDFGDEGGHV